jgi:hypothetical protein
MEVFALDKGKLLLINSFNSKQTPDHIYYLLYVWQQLGYSQEKDSLYLAGEVESKDVLLAELKRFLRQVDFLPTQSTLSFDIQSLMTCE